MGAASADRREVGEAFGEDRQWARRGATDEATDVESQGDQASGTGTIREAAPVATVDAGRAAATERTTSGTPGRVDGEDDSLVIVGEIVEAKTDEMWEELGERHE